MSKFLGQYDFYQKICNLEIQTFPTICIDSKRIVERFSALKQNYDCNAVLLIKYSVLFYNVMHF